MLAILIQGKYVTGVFPDYTEDIQLNGDFVLVDELPSAFIDQPLRSYVEYVDGEFTLVTFPEPPDPEPSPEELRIIQLETELASQNLAIIDLWETILG